MKDPAHSPPQTTEGTVRETITHHVRYCKWCQDRIITHLCNGGSITQNAFGHVILHHAARVAAEQQIRANAL